MAPFADVFGRLHPLILHLPIGLVVGIVVVEAVAIFRGRRGNRRRGRAAPVMLLWLTAAAALVAVATGLKLAAEDGYGGRTLDLHQWLGIAFAAAAVVTATIRTLAGPRPRPARLWLYRGALLLTFGLVGAAGHLGASMTHGENFLFEPFETYAKLADADQPDGGATIPAASNADIPMSPLSEEGFDAITPILSERCYACHSGSRTKGGLALDGFNHILAGGNTGPAIAVDAPASSELLRRILLPVEEEGHMPPAGKRQLTPEEIAAIEAWVKGAEASPAVIAGTDAPAPQDAEDLPPADELPTLATPPDPAAVAAIDATLAHISPLKADSNLLWIDLSSAFPPLQEQQILDLLRPVAPNVVELTLSRCNVTDEFATIAAGMPHLQRLNLHATDVSDSTVLALAKHPTLRELVLTQTNVSDAAVPSLLDMPALEQVYLWGAQLTPEGLEQLRAGEQDLLADAGATRQSDVLVVEPEPKLVDAGTIAAPPPPVPGVPASASLEPVNTVCPVSDNPVNPQYLVVHEGKVIGFCCPECPKQFWADPATFIAKLK